MRGADLLSVLLVSTLAGIALFSYQHHLVQVLPYYQFPIAQVPL